jgi:hypothetical protein
VNHRLGMAVVTILTTAMVVKGLVLMVQAPVPLR